VSLPASLLPKARVVSGDQGNRSVPQVLKGPCRFRPPDVEPEIEEQIIDLYCLLRGDGAWAVGIEHGTTPAGFRFTRAIARRLDVAFEADGILWCFALNRGRVQDLQLQHRGHCRGEREPWLCDGRRLVAVAYVRAGGVEPI
jgi:hypothetical protein